MPNEDTLSYNTRRNLWYKEKKESSEESPYENTLTLIQAHDVMPIEIAHRHCLLDKAPNITQVKSTHVLDKCKF